MNKILITGTSGFVGSRVARALQDRYELLTPSHGECDIARLEAVEEYVRRHRPEVILHLAALSNTGYCEQHPEESLRVNVQGVVHMVHLSAHPEQYMTPETDFAECLVELIQNRWCLLRILRKV